MTIPVTEAAPVLREPSRFATYPGDQTHAIGQHMGPTTFGDFVTVITAEHDVSTNTTRLGFAYGKFKVAEADV